MIKKLTTLARIGKRRTRIVKAFGPALYLGTRPVRSKAKKISKKV